MIRLAIAIALVLLAAPALAQTTTSYCTRQGSQIVCDTRTQPPPSSIFNQPLGSGSSQSETICQRMGSVTKCETRPR